MRLRSSTKVALMAAAGGAAGALIAGPLGMLGAWTATQVGAGAAAATAAAAGLMEATGNSGGGRAGRTVVVAMNGRGR